MSGAGNGIIFAKMDSRKGYDDLLSCICAGIERMETETGQIYWNGELKRSLAHLEGVDERYRESDQRQLTRPEYSEQMITPPLPIRL